MFAKKVFEMLFSVYSNSGQESRLPAPALDISSISPICVLPPIEDQNTAFSHLDLTQENGKTPESESDISAITPIRFLPTPIIDNFSAIGLGDGIGNPIEFPVQTISSPNTETTSPNKPIGPELQDVERTKVITKIEKLINGSTETEKK
jgi:hypothetical protein